jgi:hypothetical protein
VVLREKHKVAAVMLDAVKMALPSCCLTALGTSAEEQVITEDFSDSAAEEHLGYRSPLEPPRSFGHKLFTVSASSARSSLSSASSERSTKALNSPGKKDRLDPDTPYYVELWTRARYDGTLDEDGRFHNNGRYYFSDGRLYEGDFVHGHMQGVGRFSWPVGENGVVNGGDFSPKNGDSMELSPEVQYATFYGTFETDKPVNGILRLPDGTVVEGDVTEATAGLMRPPAIIPGRAVLANGNGNGVSENGKAAHPNEPA